MTGMMPPLGLLDAELRQREDEGCNIPDTLQSEIDSVLAAGVDWDLERIDPLYDQLMSVAPDPDLVRREPNDLDDICALRPANHVDDLHWQPDRDTLIDRLHGAWTGRAAGCAMGKPAEIVGILGEPPSDAAPPDIEKAMRHEPSFTGRTWIRKYLEKRGAWPLSGYWPAPVAGDGFTTPFLASCREHITCMEWDDDIHYTLIGLKVLEDRGPGFDWVDVATCWTQQIPFGLIFTAETQALLNVLQHSAFGFERLDANTTPQYTRAHRNPFREWIGARIRSDGWAFAAAGKPALAAEFAWRDAAWTHERNGIYSAMMFAAMQSAAFVERDPERLIGIGLGQIPAECRLTGRIRDCLEWASSEPDFESCMERLEAAVAGMPTAHAISNTLVCIIGLIYGQMDPLESPAVSVMCGLDTDCNGASVGSIVGAAAGRQLFDPNLATPLNDRILTRMADFHDVSMTDLARRHAKIWHRVDAYHSSRQA